jgi:hypothetical protein
VDEQAHSVALFFGLTPDGGGVPEEMTHAIAGATRAAVQQAATNAGVIKAIFERGVPATQWASAASQVIALLRKELNDLSLPALLAKGWATYAPLKQYAEEGKYPPEQVCVVPLFKHTLSSIHHPVIEMRLDGLSAGKVNFEVNLSLTFQDVALEIQNKRFLGVKTGSAEGSGTLKCEGAQILERKFGKIELPGSISFGSGYPINPFAAEGVSAS